MNKINKIKRNPALRYSAVCMISNNIIIPISITPKAIILNIASDVI